MLDSPLVSIIIPNYNYGKFLPQSIESVLQQTYKNLEIIVVDDGSTDNSKEVILNYKNKIISIFQENGGHSSALSTGFLNSTGEIICLLDADDLFQNDKVEKVVKIFRSHPEIKWCFNAVNFIDSETGNMLGRSRQKETQLCDFRWSAKNLGRIPFASPPTSGMCFNRAFLEKEKIMPLNQDLQMGADRYLSFVAVAKSQGFFIDEFLTTLRIHGENDNTMKQGLDIELKRASKRLLVAEAIKRKHTDLANLADFLLAKSQSFFWSKRINSTENKKQIKSYCSDISFLRNCKIILLSMFVFLITDLPKSSWLKRGKKQLATEI